MTGKLVTGKLVTGKLVTGNYYSPLTTHQSPITTHHSPITNHQSPTSPHVEIIHIDPTMDEAAWQLLKDRQDKEWSLVDCASFVIMRQRGITEALATDRHFEQAGFVRLLKP